MPWGLLFLRLGALFLVCWPAIIEVRNGANMCFLVLTVFVDFDLFLFLIFILCVPMCVCMCITGQYWASSVVAFYLIFHLELPILARYAGQWAPGVPLSLPPSSTGIAIVRCHTLPHSAFIWELGSELRSPCLCSKLFAQQAISQFLCGHLLTLDLVPSCGLCCSDLCKACRGNWKPRSPLGFVMDRTAPSYSGTPLKVALWGHRGGPSPLDTGVNPGMGCCSGNTLLTKQ